MTRDSKQAEKAYLSRAATDRWERVKPFSSPGHDDVHEGARLIHDFAVALLCLQPHPGDRILDLGAGSCWVSEWLQRFNIQTVSVDIAADMLRIGRQRLGADAWLVGGDLEHLPLAAASVDKAVCLNAYHHVPDGPAALAEVHRVLRPGGRVLFAEPGQGHADADTSRSAVGSWGVQEAEVVAGTLVADLTAAGFADVFVKPVAYTIPWYEVNAARWRRWQQHAAERRPLRAWRRIVRAIAEGLGVAKDGIAFEDALGMELVRILKGAIDTHPIVVATRPL